MFDEALLVLLAVGVSAGWLVGQTAQGTRIGAAGDLAIGLGGAFFGGWLLPQLGARLDLCVVAAIVAYAALRLVRPPSDGRVAEIRAVATGHEPIVDR